MIEPSLNADDLADTRLACIHSITYLRKYVEGDKPPHYQVPAIRYRNWVEIGYLSALNGFNTDNAFEFIKRYF